MQLDMAGDEISASAKIKGVEEHRFMVEERVICMD